MIEFLIVNRVFNGVLEYFRYSFRYSFWIYVVLDECVVDVKFVDEVEKCVKFFW